MIRMPLLLLQSAGDFSQWGVAGAVLMLVVVFLGFLLKVLPTWRDVKSREFDVRTEEAKVSGQISTAILQSANAQSQLAGAIDSLGGTLNHIAVEQRKTTDNLLILQRVNNEDTNRLSETVDVLVDRMDSMETTIKEHGLYGSHRPKAVASKRD